MKIESIENHEQLYHFRLPAISDWQYDLPTMINPDYNYLDRIVTAVKEAFREEAEALPTVA
jgi:hypothetical protein